MKSKKLKMIKIKSKRNMSIVKIKLFNYKAKLAIFNKKLKINKRKFFYYKIRRIKFNN